MQSTDESLHTSQTRFEYQYDEHGNWTERIVWSRHDSQTDFRRSKPDPANDHVLWIAIFSW